MALRETFPNRRDATDTSRKRLMRLAPQEPVSRNHSLSQTETAVAGRNFVMRKDRESSCFQVILQAAAEVSIVQCPAAQTNTGESSLFADQTSNSPQDFCKAIVKALADHTGTCVAL